MPQKKINRFFCPEHGLVLHHECLICKSKEFAEKVKNGEAEAFLFDGAGPDENDPSPIQIALRAAHERRIRLKNKQWEDEPRVVREYKSKM